MGAVGAEGAAPIVVEAERIDGAFTGGLAGEGEAEGVRIAVGDTVVTAARARWQGNRWVLEEGTWTETRGAVRFGRAEMLLAGPSDVGATLGAGVDDVVLRDVAFTPCTCDDGRPGALRFRAAVATLQVDGREVRGVHLQDAILEVRRVAVLRLPTARVPLQEDGLRWRLPEIGRGDDGWRVAVPFAWTQASVDGHRTETLFAPRWRERRGFGLAFAHACDEGEVRADGGWDAVLARPRGAVATSGHVGRATGASSLPASLAWNVDVASDANWARDMGTGWSAREVPWRESRARAVVGGLEAEAWLPDDGSGGTVARLRAARALADASALGTWAWALRPGVEVGLDASEDPGATPVDTPVLPSGGVPRTLLGATGSARLDTSLLVGELDLGVQGGHWSVGGAPASELRGAAGGTARAAVPLWADLPGTDAPLVLAPGIDARALGTLATEGSGVVGSVGPSLRLGLRGTRVTLDLDARWGVGGGGDPGVVFDGTVGAMRAGARSDALGDEGRLGWETARGGLAASAARLVDPAGGGVAEGGVPPSAPFTSTSSHPGWGYARETVLVSGTRGWMPRQDAPRVGVARIDGWMRPLARVRADAGVAWVAPGGTMSNATTVLSGALAYGDGCTEVGVRASGALDGSELDVGFEVRVR